MHDYAFFSTASPEKSVIERIVASLGTNVDIIAADGLAPIYYDLLLYHCRASFNLACTIDVLEKCMCHYVESINHFILLTL